MYVCQLHYNIGTGKAPNCNLVELLLVRFFYVKITEINKIDNLDDKTCNISTLLNELELTEKIITLYKKIK